MRRYKVKFLVDVLQGFNFIYLSARNINEAEMKAAEFLRNAYGERCFIVCKLSTEREIKRYYKTRHKER